MIVDANQDSAAEHKCDVCIVGAGPAGISLARALAAAGRDVILLESGGKTPEADTQELSQAEQRGVPTDAVSGNRMRVLGGTSMLWGGWCRPLDSEDFEARPWVPHSGWPIDRTAIEPYIDGALDACGAPVGGFDVPEGERTLDSPLVQNVAFRASRPARRFGTHFASELEASDKIRVLLHANLMRLLPNDAGQAIAQAEVGTLTGRRFAVRARAFVVAAGAIENARLLLASQLGGPQVGRFFMQHPVFTNQRRLSWTLGGVTVVNRDTRVPKVFIVTRFTTEACRQAKILRCHYLDYGGADAVLEHPGDDTVSRFQRQRKHRQHLAAQAAEDADTAKALASIRDPDERLTLITKLCLRTEQAPNPDSCVTLGDDRDALGMPRAIVDWQLSELDVRTAREAGHVLSRALGGLDLARIKPAPADFDPREATEPLHGGHHHYGTTRMGTDPAQSVVDANLRVHGMGNLYMAGSSVFPTTGYCNPTLTITAFSLRLAAHLDSALPS